MKTLLVLAQQAGFADAIRAVVDPQRYRVAHYRELWEAEPALRQSTIDACVLDTDLTNVQPIRTIEKLRKLLPQCPILIYAGNRQREWEEEALLQGVSQVLTKPVRGRMLNLLLERLWPALAMLPPQPPVSRPVVANPPAPGNHRNAAELLGILRDFSIILTHSLQADALLKEFLLLLREILGVNRAAVFLRQPSGLLSDPSTTDAARRLRAACAIGVPPGLLGQFDLSLEAGIGGFLFRSGRILRREAPEAERDMEMQKEFELLGAQVAVPILDRENLVGVALFDGRVTGEPLVNGELNLIFHLLEQLGLAIRNIWLHDQVMASHEMMTDVLRQLHSACLVVGWDLNVLHANDAARAYFTRAERRGLPLEFTDLPQVLGSKVFEVLKSGHEIRNFRYSLSTDQKRTFRVTITPFRRANFAATSAALVLVEDSTDEEKLHNLEIEAANLRLVKTMAERLSHEVGNAIVPLSTHQQLFREKRDDAEFLESLQTALDDSVKRVSRLASQMLYLARDLPGRVEAVALEQLVHEAFREAQRHQPDSQPILAYENGASPITLYGDHAGLKYALYEVILNALQANPKDSKVSVRSKVRADAKGVNWVDIEIKDTGPGFTAQSADKAVEPFFTTRNVGLGLGLTVCQKIVAVHNGKLQIEKPEKQHPGVVRISLPLVPNPDQPAHSVHVN
ncbi:MAG: response regulator [Verrucomicrobia bacterium]|nr:response regulator [Verrucomicrobiota bacterium]